MYNQYTRTAQIAQEGYGASGQWKLAGEILNSESDPDV
jgi:hypothetical protein